jgi:lysyl-tRNA synthetase class 1
VVGERNIPDLANVDADIIAYWAMRMAAATHPVLRARYADLVWDLSKAAIGNKPPIDACRIAIDSYVAASSLARGSTSRKARDRLARALKLALSVGDTARSSAVCDAMFDLVGRFPGDFHWVWLFDIVFDDRKLSVSEERRQTLVAELQRIVGRVASLESGAGSIEVMPVAMRLATYYQSLGNENRAKEIIQSCGLSIERLAARADGMLGLAWLSSLHDTYKASGLSTSVVLAAS